MDIKEALTFDGLKYFYTKYIKPLKTGAFSTVVNNATTTVANTVLDGRMGKTLADKDANLQSQINTLNSSLEYKKYGDDDPLVGVQKIGDIKVLKVITDTTITTETMLTTQIPTEFAPLYADYQGYMIVRDNITAYLRVTKSGKVELSRFSNDVAKGTYVFAHCVYI